MKRPHFSLPIIGMLPLMGAALALGAAVSPQWAQAQPPTNATINLQPANRPARPKAKRPGKAGAATNVEARQDKMVKDYTAIFGQPLTADQTAQIAKATEARDAAILAATDAWQKQFLLTTNMTEEEVRQKQKAYRQGQLAAKQGGAVTKPAPETPVATDATPTKAEPTLAAPAAGGVAPTTVVVPPQ